MLRSLRGTPAALAAGLAALAFAAPAAAQTKDDVRFTTVDNVEIIGSYYPGKGKNSPCVLMLHELYKDQTKGDWDKLAKDLQKKFGYAVLTFDFRGHGKSVNVTPNFWQHAFNSTYIKGAKPNKQTIDVKEFSVGYFPAFINDITAARYFLDQKNDAQECNSGNLLIVGAGDGAALGMLWATTEWIRNTSPRPMIGFQPPPGGGRMAGGDIKGAVWLGFANPSEKIWGRTPLQYANWLKVAPELRDKVPQLFLHGDEDKVGAKTADFLYRQVLKANLDTAKLPKPTNTFIKPVKSTKLTGVALLTAPEVEDLVTKYIERTNEKQTIIWGEKDTRNQQLFPVPLGQFGFQNWVKPAGIR